MIDTKAEDANVVKDYCINCSSGYVPIGTEIDINDEKFNVISQTDDTITMLAQYNLGTDYKQNTPANSVTFSDADGWEYTPGPKEIDIQTWSTNPKTYVNAYVVYLKEKIGDNTVTGNLITLTELSNLGCIVPSDYAKVSSSSLRTCANSPYKSWLLNGQWWWTRSASSSICNNVWSVSYGSGLSSDYYEYYGGVRPVITISKETLNNIT